MRHRIYGKHLGRNNDERQTLFKGLVCSLISYGSIQTSETKAKAIKGLIDKVINVAKNKDTRRLLQNYLADKNLQERLIKEIVPKLGNRNSGYTRLVRLGARLGDQTMMVRLSLIGSEELKPISREKVSKGKKVSKISEVKKEKSAVKKEEKKSNAVTKSTKTRKTVASSRKKK